MAPHKTGLGQKRTVNLKPVTDQVGHIALCKVVYSIFAILNHFSFLYPFGCSRQLLFVFLCAPTIVSGALGCTLMLSLMSKCRVDSGKIQRDTVITAYVAKEEDLYGHSLCTPIHLQH